MQNSKLDLLTILLYMTVLTIIALEHFDCIKPFRNFTQAYQDYLYNDSTESLELSEFGRNTIMV
jgi:hypothetical protein